jgi:tetratricopeptide (TPR) repeat protein
MRLSPRDPALGDWYNFIGVANLYLGRLDVAAERFRKSVELNPSYGLAYFMLTAALALMGHDAEAAEACAAGRQLDENFSIAKFRADTRSDTQSIWRSGSASTRVSPRRGCRKSESPG